MGNVSTAIKIVSFIVLLLWFTACGKVGFNASSDNLSSFGDGAQLKSVSVTTKKNMPVAFSAGLIQGQTTAGSLSFNGGSQVSLIQTDNGTIEITDPATFAMKYTPNESFVGVDNVKVYATDKYGHAIPGVINVTVGNILNSIQPALAVRGMSCITCHSGVSSNIIADYGYGNSWYFDTSSSDSYYYDRLGADNGLSTLSLLNGSQLIVPQAPVPTSVQSAFNVSSLAQFVQARFAQGTLATAAQVKEVNALKISVPTAGRIQQLFGNPSANVVYIPDTQKSPALSGANFDSVNGVFKISNLVCDGDLYLGAPVLFENAQVASLAGCRIYTTRSVFVDGNVTSIAYNGSTNYNTQILSTESIWVGVGLMFDSTGKFCENTAAGVPTGWYAQSTCQTSASQNLTQCNSFLERNAAVVARNTFTRAYPDAASLNALMGPTGLVATEFAAVQASLGSKIYDASCSAQGRAVDTNRLMLVAPYVNDRLTGEFSGSVVSEAALMSLGTFKFQFDPVFKSNSIFSLLDADELVSGQF